MKQVLIFHEKGADRIFDGSTKELVEAAMLARVKERVDDGFWYEDNNEHVEMAQNVVDVAKHDVKQAIHLAKELLIIRRYYEYEEFGLYNVETTELREEG